VFQVDDIRMCAGKQELLDRAILALNFGVKYGLVGRNGGAAQSLNALAQPARHGCALALPPLTRPNLPASVPAQLARPLC
jgi:hypothetical protein